MHTQSEFELGPPKFRVSGPNSILSSKHAELLAMTKWFLSSLLLPSIKHSACATPPQSIRVCVQGHLDSLCVIQMFTANFGNDFFPLWSADWNGSQQRNQTSYRLEDQDMTNKGMVGMFS